MLNITSNNKTSSSLIKDERKQSFQLIWYYWYLKYYLPQHIVSINQSQHDKVSSIVGLTSPQHDKASSIVGLTSPQHDKASSIVALTSQQIHLMISPLKQVYQIQGIQTHLQTQLSRIKQRAISSHNNRFFVIHPQQQINQIQNYLKNSSRQYLINGQLQQCLSDFLVELYSYYLNSKNVYLIYKGFACSLKNSFQSHSISSSSTQNRIKMILTHNSSESRLNTSKDSKASDDRIVDRADRIDRRSLQSMKSSIVRLEDQSLIVGDKNQSFGEEKMENKIEEMEMIDKMVETEGLELWNVNYKKIPHTYVKFKKQSWTSCLNLGLAHPSCPKTINQLPILPRLKAFSPSLDKLPIFISLLKQLQSICPSLLPSIDSIFQYNELPYIFLQQDNNYGQWKWQTNVGVLCYFIVFGNDQGDLTARKVDRYVQQNPETLLAKNIREMTKRQKDKNKKRKELTKIVNTKEHLTHHTQLNNNHLSLHLLINKDENSDLAIW